MVGRSQYVFRTTALDPDLLSSPFAVQTKWHVITGPPSCGKTTLIDLLAERSFQTVPEWARAFMEQEMTGGRSIDEIHGDAVALQRMITESQLRIEAGLPASEVLFLDGAVAVSLAWYRLFGLDPNELLPECFHHRYATVFVLDQLPIRLDGFRFDDDVHTRFLDEWIARDCRSLGYDVVRVPVLSPEERLAFVFERLSKHGQT